MADVSVAPPSGGFLSGLSNILQSPAVQQLLPVALGAMGGYLTTPREAGFGGGLGRGLLGAEQGLITGNEAYQNAQHLALVNQQVQQAMSERKKDQPTIAGINKTLFGGPLMNGVLPGDVDVSNLDPDAGMKLFTTGSQIMEARLRGQRPNIQYKTVDIDGKPTLVQEMQSPQGGPPQQTVIGVAYQDPNKIAEEQAATQAHQASAAVQRAKLGPGGQLLPPPEDADLVDQRKATIEHMRAATHALQTGGVPKPETPYQKAQIQAGIARDVRAQLNKELDDKSKTLGGKLFGVGSDARQKYMSENYDKRLKAEQLRRNEIPWPDGLTSGDAAAKWLAGYMGMSEQAAVQYLKTH